MTNKERVGQNFLKIVKEATTTVKSEFTRLGMAFLPEARGANNPLPPRKGRK